MELPFAMSPERVEVLVWILVYGGLLLLGIGYAVQHRGAPWGWAWVAVGAATALAGFVLIWVRARMGAEPEPLDERTST